ncbi:MAG: IclR family transcriptional regulator [Deltaproteobacteria bacterium]|nr:IclR family transcriptional regulator [Deltaproteobacteria bacterium]MBW2361966.1 IclR family transcriptional regulator [Deltaproteobacteria bacterium]
MRKPKGEYAIQTVINAMRLLEAFRDEEELGVTELSRRLELHKNNVFRLLATLEQEGYIEQSADTERYHLGVRVLELGSSFTRSRSLLCSAEPVLEALAAGTGETCHLGVLRDFEVVYMRGHQTERAVMSGLREGRRLPAHCTALGKVLVGCAPEELRQAYGRFIGDGALEARTENTIVDRHKLFDHLRAVGGRGLAFDLSECDDGLVCVAAPVHAAGGRVVAALSVSGPQCRLDEARLRSEVAPQVVVAAEQLSKALGYV